MSTTTSWVGAGFFCLWTKPDQGPGPANFQPVIFRSRAPMVMCALLQVVPGHAQAVKNASRPAALVSNWT